MKILYLLLAALFIPGQAFAHEKNIKITAGEGIFSHYKWYEIVNPFLVVALIVTYFLFIRITNKYAVGKEQQLERKNKVYMIIALVTILIALTGPVQIFADNMLFSAYMLQQSLMYIIVPPFILLATPGSLIKPFVLKYAETKLFKLLTSSLTAILMFNFLWSLVHMPFFYEWLLRHPFQTIIVHMIVNGAAFLMWVQVLPPVEGISRLSDLKKLAYMFANGMLITPACALIIFAGDVIYPSLLEAPEIFKNIIPPLADQQAGGVIMKVVQELSYGTVIGYVFFKWARKERKKENEELVQPNLSYLNQTK